MRQRSIPGGGAEILRPQRRVSNKKGTSADWLHVMGEAQDYFKTTATMMYGHLKPMRTLSNISMSPVSSRMNNYGFAFIPWSSPGTRRWKIIPLCNCQPLLSIDRFTDLP
jgi:hypothetical protein